jgi:C_GCAxxG_C_C family probable redox protein
MNIKVDETVTAFDRSIVNGKKYNCCQAIIATYGEVYGLDVDTALNVSRGFGMGMAQGSVCGAVTGAYMAISYINSIDDKIENKSIIPKLIREFSAKFKARNGSLICKELLPQNLVDVSPAVKNRIIKKTDLCPKFVRDAAEILEEICKM